VTTRIAPSNSRSVADTIVYLFFIVLLAAVVALVGYVRHTAGFFVLGATILVLSLLPGVPIMRRDRALRRCHPELVLDTTPIPAGGRLTGNVEFAADSDTVVEPIRVKLLWLRRAPNGSMSRTVWQEAKEFARVDLQRINGGLAVPVAFDIPENAEASGDVSVWGYTVWCVDIRGAGFNARFEVPVRKKNEAAA
jgi:hypothetical protein